MVIFSFLVLGVPNTFGFDAGSYVGSGVGSGAGFGVNLGVRALF